MSAASRSIYLRRAVITRLRADAPLLAITTRIYGMKSPATLTWPFTRYGTPNETARSVSCWDGSDVAFTYHAFSKTEFEDQCAAMNEAIVASLGDAVLTMAGDIKANIVWLGSDIMADGDEANAYHGVNRFGARI
jgi:hypothetical protein